MKFLIAILISSTLFFLGCGSSKEAAKEKIIKLPSGLQYVVLEEGTGLTPVEGDKVTVHYTGKLEDGTVFDSSVLKDKPLVFDYKVTKMIDGFEEGLATMKEGGKRKLIIPPDMGYGSRGSRNIPPNSTLIFEVELIKVEK